MFVRDFIHVGQPFEAVAPRFVSDTSWLAPIAEEAAIVARDVALSLGLATEGDGHPAPGGGTCGAAHTGNVVRCRLGPVRARADSILVPMWLIDLRGGSPLPDLAGDLEVAPVGAGACLVALGATYRRTAREPDTVLRVERATEAGVRSFLNGIAAFLGRPTPAV
jgi:hypothetical protein